MNFGNPTDQAQESLLIAGVDGLQLRGVPVRNCMNPEGLRDICRARLLSGHGWSRKRSRDAQESGLQSTRMVQVVTDAWGRQRPVSSLRRLPSSHPVSYTESSDVDLVPARWIK